MSFSIADFTRLRMAVNARRFQAASADRVRSQWTTVNLAIDAEIYQDLTVLKARSRELMANDPYGKRFVHLAKKNIVGPMGVMFQSKSRNQANELNRAENRIIEREFRRFGKRGQFDVTAKLGRADFERLFIETLVVDGEVLIRKVKNYANRARYALQFIDTDRLDIRLNEPRNPGTGTHIRMGVELDDWMRPVAYHILTRHPLTVFGEAIPIHRERIPAEDIIHAFVPMRPEQTRGIPWMHAAMIALKDLGGYREAAIINARIGAAKMGVLTNPEGTAYTGDSQIKKNESDRRGAPVMEVEAGTFQQAPTGWKLEAWNPAYPHEQFEPFNKAMLHGISAGLDIAYHSLSTDLEGVNYTSSRTGLIEERDTWVMLQSCMIEWLHDDYYPEWLRHQMVIGTLPLDLFRFDEFNEPRWLGRRWKWTDPLKDESANALAWGMRTKSLRTIIAERDARDPDEVFEEIAEDMERLKALGIEPTLPSTIKMEDDRSETDYAPEKKQAR